MQRLWLLALALGAFWTPVSAATTTVTQTLYRADGVTTRNGSVTISWTTFISAADGHRNAAGSFTTRVTNGAFSVAVEPNDTAIPSTQYKVVYHLDGGPSPETTEYWTCPTSGSPVDISACVTTPTPAGAGPISLSSLGQGGATTGQCLTWNPSTWGPAGGCWIVNGNDIYNPNSRSVLIGGSTNGNYKLDVQGSGSAGTLRLFDQLAVTGKTQFIINPGAGQSTTNLGIFSGSGLTQSGLGPDASLWVGNSSSGKRKWAAVGGATPTAIASSDVCLGWRNVDSLDAAGAVDSTICRNGAGIVEISNGTPGTYRDLHLRNITIDGTCTGAGCPGGGGILGSNVTTTTTVLTMAAGVCQLPDGTVVTYGSAATVTHTSGVADSVTLVAGYDSSCLRKVWRSAAVADSYTFSGFSGGAFVSPTPSTGLFIAGTVVVTAGVFGTSTGRPDATPPTIITYSSGLSSCGTNCVQADPTVPPAYSIGSNIASSGTIAPTAPITHITGTTTINTITAPAGFTAAGGCLDLVADGLWNITAAGNVAIAFTPAVGDSLHLCYDNAATKWYHHPSGGSAGVILSTSTTLSNSNILNLFTTPIQLVAAAGANTVIDPVEFSVEFIGSTAFTCAGVLKSGYTTSLTASASVGSSNILTGYSANTFVTSMAVVSSGLNNNQSNGTASTAISNTGLFIGMSTSNCTGGSGSTAVVTVSYRVIGL